MKFYKILFLYLLPLFGMSQTFNNGVIVLASRPIDLRESALGGAGVGVPYANLAAAHNASTFRFVGAERTVFVNGVQQRYWYVGDTTLASLVPMNTVGGSPGGGVKSVQFKGADGNFAAINNVTIDPTTGLFNVTGLPDANVAALGSSSFFNVTAAYNVNGFKKMLTLTAPWGTGNLFSNWNWSSIIGGDFHQHFKLGNQLNTGTETPLIDFDVEGGSTSFLSPLLRLGAYVFGVPNTEISNVRDANGIYHTKISGIEKVGQNNSYVELNSMAVTDMGGGDSSLSSIVFDKNGHAGKVPLNAPKFFLDNENVIFPKRSVTSDELRGVSLTWANQFAGVGVSALVINADSTTTVTGSNLTVGAAVVKLSTNESVIATVSGVNPTTSGQTPMAVIMFKNGDFMALTRGETGNATLTMSYQDSVFVQRTFPVYANYTSYSLAKSIIEVGVAQSGKPFIKLNGLEMTFGQSVYTRSIVTYGGFGVYAPSGVNGTGIVSQIIKQVGVNTPIKKDIGLLCIGDSRKAPQSTGSWEVATSLLENTFGCHVSYNNNIAVSGAGAADQWNVFKTKLLDSVNLVYCAIGTNDIQYNSGIAHMLLYIDSMYKKAKGAGAVFMVEIPEMWYSSNFNTSGLPVGGGNIGTSNYDGGASYRMALESYCVKNGISYNRAADNLPPAIYGNGQFLDNIHSTAKNNIVKGWYCAKAIAEVYMQDRSNFAYKPITDKNFPDFFGTTLFGKNENNDGSLLNKLTFSGVGSGYHYGQKWDVGIYSSDLADGTFGSNHFVLNTSSSADGYATKKTAIDINGDGKLNVGSMKIGVGLTYLTILNSATDNGFTSIQQHSHSQGGQPETFGDIAFNALGGRFLLPQFAHNGGGWPMQLDISGAVVPATNGVIFVIVNTYADALNVPLNQNAMTVIRVSVDEHKGNSKNTEYKLYPDGKRIFVTTVEDN